MEKRKRWMRLAIYTAGYGMFSDNVVIPIITNIEKSFPKANTFSINFILSGCGLFSILAAIITGLLVQKFNKRKILIAGTVIFTVGGVLGAFSKTIGFLCVTRVVDAISDGVLTTVCAMLIAQICHDEKERSVIMGRYNAISCLFGVIMSVAAGYLAVYSWRFAFLMHAVSIISVVFCILFIPKDLDDSRKTDFRKDPTDIMVLQSGYRQHLLIIFSLLAFIITCSIHYQMSFLVDIYVNEKGVGNSVLSGYLSSVCTIAGLFGCLLMSFFYSKLKHLLIPVLALLSGGTLVIYSCTDKISLMFFCGTILGATGGMLVVYYEWFVIQYAPREALGFYTGLVSALVYLNGYLAVYLPQLNQYLFHANTMEKSYLDTAYILFGISAIYLCAWVYTKIKNRS